MVLKARLPSIESLPEPLREHYVKGDDGQFHLALDPADGLTIANMAKVDGALDKLRKDLAAEQKKSAEAEGKLNEAQAQLGRTKDMLPADQLAQQIANVEKQLTDKHGKERKALEDERTDLLAQLEVGLVDSALSAVIAPVGSVKGLLPHAKNGVRMLKGDAGRFEARVVDAQGNPRRSMKPGNDGYMGLAEHVEGLRSDPDLAPLFKGSGAAGGGARGSDAARGGESGTVAADDLESIGANIESIATGKVKVH